jgi:hypothetical protein
MEFPIKKTSLYFKSKITPIIKELNRPVIFDTHNIDQTVLLVGCARSGTTWVSNLLNHTNQFRYIFEPFRDEVAEMKAFSGQPFVVLPGNDDPEIEEAVQKILSGKLEQTDWLNRYNQRNFANKRIIKAVRAHFFLKSLHDRFPQVPIIYLMRHPIPSSLSKDHTQWGWKTGQDFWANPILRDTHLQPFEEVILSARTDFEKYVTTWCIQNYVVLKEMEAGDYLITYYEDFCLRPEAAVREMNGYVNAPFNQKAFEKMVGQTFMLHEKSGVRKNENMVTSWQKKVTPEQINSAMRIVRAFGLDAYYDESPFPRKSRFNQSG